MYILSHRGYWINATEKNQLAAFERACKLGFGTETDIRDYNGEIFISHDFPDKASISLDDFLSIYKKYNSTSPLALNIKSDGLQVKLNELLVENNIANYFVFDMSVPDTIGYINTGINFFSRQS